MEMIVKSAHQFLSTILPRNYFINYALALPRLYIKNGRLPHPKSSAHYALNDHIFNVMIWNDLSLLDRISVDKQFTKIVAAGLADTYLPPTVEVYSIHSGTAFSDFLSWLRNFSGKNYEFS